MKVGELAQLLVSGAGSAECGPGNPGAPGRHGRKERRRIPHAGRQIDETPSKQDAGRQFADIWAEAIHSNRNLRIVTVALGMGLFLVLIVTLRLAWQPPPKPIVVRVDEVGRAEALDL